VECPKIALIPTKPTLITFTAVSFQCQEETAALYRDHKGLADAGRQMALLLRVLLSQYTVSARDHKFNEVGWNQDHGLVKGFGL